MRKGNRKDQDERRDNPDITVLLPVFNGGDYLRQSVESVLAQNFTTFELLVIDDCSTDGSLKYLQSLTDSRITRYTNESNRGLFYNLNFLIGKSRSKLIKLWAQDDIMYLHCLESFVAFHAQNPGLGFSYCKRDMINEIGDITDTGIADNTPSIISPNLHAGIAYFIGSIASNISTVCLNREVLDKVGWFNTQMKISADFDMWVRLARNHNVGFINEKLIKLRGHVGQLSRNESLYIYHLREDLEVYSNLNSFMPNHLRIEGTKLLRYEKLIFYYTLMLKALIKGKFITAYLFYKELAAFDNFILLSFAYLKVKLWPSVPSDFLEKFR